MSRMDPAELLQCLLDITRTQVGQNLNTHIASEFLCASSSAGSKGDNASQHPAQPQPDSGGTTTPAGPATTGKPTEDEWWKYQDRDMNWVRHWEEEELDNEDPQSWK